MIPVFNEAATVAELVRRVRPVPLDVELIAINDASRDGSGEILAGCWRPRAARSWWAPSGQSRQGRCAPHRDPGRNRRRDRGPGRGSRIRSRPNCRGCSGRSRRTGPTPCTARASWGVSTGCCSSGTRVGNRIADAAVEHVHRSEPDRHGNLLQDGAGAAAQVAGADQRALRLRAGGDRPAGAGRCPHLGDADLLRRSDLRRGQEDRLAGRSGRGVPHPPLQPVSAARRAHAGRRRRDGVSVSPDALVRLAADRGRRRARPHSRTTMPGSLVEQKARSQAGDRGRPRRPRDHRPGARGVGSCHSRHLGGGEHPRTSRCAGRLDPLLAGGPARRDQGVPASTTASSPSTSP